MDGFHHPFEHRVEKLARCLGISVGEQLHRALHVGKQNGDLLPFTFEGGLRSEDLLGEMLGGVGLGRDMLRVRSRAGAGKRAATTTAELLTPLILKPARWAGRGER